MNSLSPTITKATLKKDAPSWHWFANRHGVGWRYTGIKRGKQVRVIPFAVMCGPAEDDYVTQWRVDDGEKTVDYTSWVMTVGRF